MHRFKYKTELCKNFSEFGECKYGDQCHFAHGESELMLKTLGERRDVGMVGGDVRTFRVRPCFDHVATGSCPFGSKCINIHDQRLDGSQKFSLKCKQYSLRENCSSDYSFHIDGSRETKLAQIHHGEPFGPNTAAMMSSYRTFKAAVCNSSSDNKDSRVRNFQRVQIAQIMSNARTFPFSMPSHLVFGRVCLILQERAFYVPSEASGSISVTEIVDEAQLKMFPTIERSSPGSIVVAREISFGAPGSASAEEQPAIWYDIPEEVIQRVDSSTIKRQIKRLRDCPVTPSFSELACAVSSWDPFYVYFSDREDTRHLIKGILSLRLRELLAAAKGKRKDWSNDTPMIQKILKARFDALKNDHLRWQWPVNKGRDVCSLLSPIPPIEGPYCIPTDARMEGVYHSSAPRNRFVEKIWSSVHKNLLVMLANDCADEDCKEECEEDNNYQSRHVFTCLARGKRIGVSMDLDNAPPKVSSGLELHFEAWSDRMREGMEGLAKET